MNPQTLPAAGAEQPAAESTSTKLDELLATARALDPDTLHPADLARALVATVTALDLVVAELRRVGAPL
jgi:hypothetical protein